MIDTQVDFLDGGAGPIPGTTTVLPTITDLVRAFRDADRPTVRVVRLYPGDDVDLARRTLLATGADTVRPAGPGSQIAPELLPDGAADLGYGRIRPATQRIGQRNASGRYPGERPGGA